MPGHQASVPRVAASYFGHTDYRSHPTIAQVFRPGKGWVRYNHVKRVSGSEVRRLRAAGVTAVALRSGARLADFTIEELSKR